MEKESNEKAQICPICCSLMRRSFDAEILLKYSISYYKCKKCGLIQTEEPYWLGDAYGSAIADLDVGLVHRNIKLSEILSDIINRHFDPCCRFLDFAGGYGLFVRLMRDNGFDFYRFDKFCDNIFAKYFDVPTLFDKKIKFELVTAFEVLEHIYDPVTELRKLFEVTDSVFFTTELLPENITSVDDWWYFVPESGQHLTFYTESSLHHLAENLSVNYFTNGSSYHLLSRRHLKDFSFCHQERQNTLKKILKKYVWHNRSSEEKILSGCGISIENDFNYIKKIIKTR